jgi:hypothetical protein
VLVNLLQNWPLYIRAISEGYCFTFCIDLIRLLLCLSKPGSLPAQDPSQPEIPVKPRSQSARDPSQPKIPVSPRSQSVLDALMPIWLMSIWYLAHAYLIFGLRLQGVPHLHKNHDFWLRYVQVGDFHISRGFTTVPLTQISCNTFFFPIIKMRVKPGPSVFDIWLMPI